jgi:triacylglycerol lipase
VKRCLLAAAALFIAAPAVAQVPPDIAAAIRKIGPVVDSPGTAKLYMPLFREVKEPYAGVTVKRDIAYGPDPLNRLDLFTPQAPQSGGGRMVVIYAHGGRFQAGDKHQPRTIFYDNLMLFLNQHGMIGVNMNYRLAPKNHWPDAQMDMAAVVRWVKANIGEYGGDPDRIVLWGQSAGAGLVAGYLSHPEFHAAGGPGVKAAIMLSGSYENGQASPYFGNDPRELRERSSVQGLTKVQIPLFISHTEVDLPNAVSQAEKLKSALCDVSRCPAYAVFKDHSHMSQVFSVGTPDVSVSGPVLQFLTSVQSRPGGRE